MTVAVIVGVVVAYRRRARDQRLAASPTSATRCVRPLLRGRATAAPPRRAAASRDVAMPQVRFALGPGHAGRPRARADHAARRRRGRHLRVRPAPSPSSPATPARLRSTRSCSTSPTASTTTCSWTSPRWSPRSARSRPSRRSWSATAVLLVVRRRYAEALVLVLGLALIYIAVQSPRTSSTGPPGGALVDTVRSRLSERPRRLRDGLDRGGRGAHAHGCGWSTKRRARDDRRVVIAAAVGAVPRLPARALLAPTWPAAGDWGRRSSRRSRPSRSSSSTSVTMGASRRAEAPYPRPPIPRDEQPGPLQQEIVIVLAGALVSSATSCSSSSRRRAVTAASGRSSAAGVLTLYVLATLLGVGAAIGFAIVWTYDTYAG